MAIISLMEALTELSATASRWILTKISVGDPMVVDRWFA